MRTALVILGLIILLFAIGWLTFSADEGGTELRLETDRIGQDTEEILDDASQVIDQARDQLETDNNVPQP